MIRAISLVLCVVGWASTAFALNPALDVSQYVHTTWRTRDGFTRGRITSIAQTPDGYLWLGTDLGLLRFDGVRTSPWQPPPNQGLRSNNIRALLAARDGTLWIGTDDGLASWKDGHLVQYEALAATFVFRLLEDREGAIWTIRFGNNWGICAIQQARVMCYGDDGGPGAGAAGFYQDRQGKLWVGAEHGVWRWGSDRPTFYGLPSPPNGIQALSEADDGALLIATVGGIRRFVDGHAAMEYPFPRSMRSEEPRRLFRDRAGGLWVGTSTRGLIHIHQGITDTFARVDGLSGDAIAAILEDREGNVWVATVDGLDRFRESPVVSYSENQGLTRPLTSVLASTDGSVLAGMYSGLGRWAQGRITVEDREPGGVQSLFEDHQRRVWLSTLRGVGYLENDRFVRVKSLPGRLTRGIVQDGRNTLWVVDPELGLFHFLPGKPEDVEHIPTSALKHDDVVSAAAADPSAEGVWLGFFRGGISHVADGQVREVYSTSNGLARGRISSLYADSDRTLWIAADGGLSRLKSGRMTTLTSTNGLPCDAAGWVIEDASRSLWVGMACGLVRIARSDFDSWSGGSERIPTTVFDQTDGVRMFAGASYYTAPVARSSEGKLWFMSQEGLSVVDPSRLPVNTIPPPVHVEQVVADRKTYNPAIAVGERLRLPPLIRDLQIDYTGLSLVAPEKMRFRYKLDGRDADWQDAGGRRQAFYSDLRPGNYQFRVIASNNSGVWNENGATLAFAIAPAYYQTAWFRALVGVSVIALLLAAYRFRLRQIASYYNARLDARVAERTRIARDLHDTLLQSFQGVLLKFHVVSYKLEDNPEARKDLEAVIEQARQAITEGRDAVRGLRASTLAGNDLARALVTFDGGLHGSSGAEGRAVLDVQVEGTSRDLAPLVHDDVYRIACEALRNAHKHAGATRIEVEIQYGERQLRLRIRDDGRGIDAEVLRHGARAGHFGLPGMHERASALGGKLTVWSERDAGTEIELTIPASIAYAKASTARWSPESGVRRVE